MSRQAVSITWRTVNVFHWSVGAVHQTPRSLAMHSRTIVLAAEDLATAPSRGGWNFAARVSKCGVILPKGVVPD